MAEFLYIVSSPPIPEPTITPEFNDEFSSDTKPESLIASSAAIKPSAINRSIFLRSLDDTIFSSISESSTVAAILQG